MWKQPQGEGIRKFDSRHFDIVITDINMPDLDGHQVAGYVRKSGKSVVPCIYFRVAVQV